MSKKSTIYYKADDIQELLGIGRTKAYEIIRMLNHELSEQGYITIAGKVPKSYADRRMRGYEEKEI